MEVTDIRVGYGGSGGHGTRDSDIMVWHLGVVLDTSYPTASRKVVDLSCSSASRKNRYERRHIYVEDSVWYTIR